MPDNRLARSAHGVTVAEQSAVSVFPPHCPSIMAYRAKNKDTTRKRAEYVVMKMKANMMGQIRRHSRLWRAVQLCPQRCTGGAE